MKSYFEKLIGLKIFGEEKTQDVEGHVVREFFRVQPSLLKVDFGVFMEMIFLGNTLMGSSSLTGLCSS